MKKLISCKYNFDNCCVELKFTDGSMIAFDTIAVENVVADNMHQRSELDYLIYNAPLEYADLYYERRSRNIFENCNGIQTFRLNIEAMPLALIVKSQCKQHFTLYSIAPVRSTVRSIFLCCQQGVLCEFRFVLFHLHEIQQFCRRSDMMQDDDLCK